MGMLDVINERVLRLQEGIQPASLLYWHNRVVRDAQELAPPWLEGLIKVRQDEHLPMKFNLDISRRATKYYMMAIDKNMPFMPHSTRLYFLRVCEVLTESMDSSLV